MLKGRFLIQPPSRMKNEARRPAGHRSLSPGLIFVQLLRLGVFGAGLGGTAVGLMTIAAARLAEDPATLLLFGAGLLTALASALLLHETLRPEPRRGRSD